MTENLLWQALDYMRQHGWTQNQWDDDAGRVCLKQSINACHTGVLEGREAYAALKVVCLEQYNTPSIIHTNDRLLHSQAEAEALLEKAAIRLSEQVG